METSNKGDWVADNGEIKKVFEPGTIARTNRRGVKFSLQEPVEAVLEYEDPFGNLLWRVTEMVAGGGEFDSPWIRSIDQPR